MLPLVIVLAVLLAVAVGVAAWAVTHGTAATPKPAATATASQAAQLDNLSGTLTLSAYNPQWKDVGQSCQGTGGYQDIRTGAQVVVTDPAGKTVALASLSSGRVVTPFEECRFDFGVGVPTGLAFYGVAIGNRKPYQVNGDVVSSPLALTLG